MKLAKDYLSVSFDENSATREKFTFAMNAIGLRGGIVDYVRAKELGISRSSYYRYYAFLESRGGEFFTHHGTVCCDVDRPMFFVRKGALSE